MNNDSIHCHCQYRRSIAIFNNIQISRHYSSASNASVSDLRIRKQSQRERERTIKAPRVYRSDRPIRRSNLSSQNEENSEVCLKSVLKILLKPVERRDCGRARPWLSSVTWLLVISLSCPTSQTIKCWQNW